MQPTTTVIVPASHLLPNLSAWTFPTGPSNPHVSATPVTTNHTVKTTVFPTTSVATTTSSVIPVTAGGTVYYINPTSMATVSAPNRTPVPISFPTIPSTATQFAPPTFITAPQPATNSFTVQDLSQLLASSLDGPPPGMQTGTVQWRSTSMARVVWPVQECYRFSTPYR